MKASHLVTGLFVTAVVLIDLVAATWLEEASELIIAAFAGLTFGQLALLAIWGVRGSSAWVLRLMLILFAASGLASLWTLATFPPWNQWLTVLCSHTLLVALLVGPYRKWSAMASLAGSDHPASATADRRRFGQWSVGGLLSLVTVFGLGLGMFRHLAIPWDHARLLIGIITILAVVAATTYWTSVAEIAFGLRLAALAIACVLGGCLLGRLEPEIGTWPLTVCTLLEAMVVSFGLGLFANPATIPRRRSYSRA